MFSKFNHETPSKEEQMALLSDLPIVPLKQAKSQKSGQVQSQEAK